jgi:hypothetical protein
VPSKELYTNPKTDISLEKPDNWNLEYIERNGMIVLETKNWNRGKVSARVEIQGPACTLDSGGFNNSKEEIEWNIDRIRILYGLNSVAMVQKPSNTEIGEYEVTKAVIVIPTMSMLNDLNRNQVGDSDPNISQTIALSAITYNDNTLMAYIYKGNDEVLNAQAQEIVDSIRITCAAKP